MMYHNKFVSCIKVNGKVLREQDGEVAIPFGSEYSILLKNMNSVRAQVRVSIDSEEVSDGWLIINPNSELNLERSIKNNNLLKGNCFKFIERTSKIEEHRGIGAEDGLVRIEYKFEKAAQPIQKVIHEHHHHNTWWNGYPYYYPTWPGQTVVIDTGATWGNPNYTNTGGLVTETTTTGSLGNAFIGGCFSEGQAQYASMNAVGSSNPSRSMKSDFLKSAPAQPVAQNSIFTCSMPENSAGITVAGSESNQKFYRVSNFLCEASNVIVLKLVGAVGETKVTKPITVDFKPTCVTCGRKNKATNKFCAECGTSLVLI